MNQNVTAQAIFYSLPHFISPHYLWCYDDMHLPENNHKMCKVTYHPSDLCLLKICSTLVLKREGNQVYSSTGILLIKHFVLGFTQSVLRYWNTATYWLKWLFVTRMRQLGSTVWRAITIKVRTSVSVWPLCLQTAGSESLTAQRFTSERSYMTSKVIKSANQRRENVLRSPW